LSDLLLLGFSFSVSFVCFYLPFPSPFPPLSLLFPLTPSQIPTPSFPSLPFVFHCTGFDDGSTVRRLAMHLGGESVVTFTIPEDSSGCKYQDRGDMVTRVVGAVPTVLCT
jgi:hypothetical protein